MLQVGVPELVVFLNKVDLLSKGDEELQELVEMEVRDREHGSKCGDAWGLVSSRGRTVLFQHFATLVLLPSSRREYVKLTVSVFRA